MSLFDSHLDTLHLFISLHRQLHLVSVQRAEDEAQPEWAEHISTGKFYSKLIIKNSTLKQIHMSLINSVSTQHWVGEFMEVNKRKIIFTEFPFCWKDFLFSLAIKKNEKILIIGNIIYSTVITAGSILLSSMLIHHCC